VLAVEDDPDMRVLLSAVLGRERWVVTATDKVDAADQLAVEVRPDLVILDVRDRNSDRAGFDVARRLRARSDVPIIFCTGADSVDDRLTGFEAGGDDYVVKPFFAEELVARARAVMRRTGKNGSDVLRAGDIVVDERSHVVVRAGAGIELTRLEFDVLATLVRQPGRVMPKTELLSRFWGADAYDVNLVERHVSDLRAKLEAHGPRVIHTVRGIGYVLRAG